MAAVYAAVDRSDPYTDRYSGPRCRSGCSAAAASLVRISPDLRPVIPMLIQALHDAAVSDRATGLLTRATPVAIDPLLAVVKDPNEPAPVRLILVVSRGRRGRALEHVLRAHQVGQLAVQLSGCDCHRNSEASLP